MSKIDINVNLIADRAVASARDLNSQLNTLNNTVRDVHNSNNSFAHSFTELKSKIDLAVQGIRVLSGAFKSVVGSAVDFEKQVAEITTLLDDATGYQQKFTKEILELQKAFGVNSADVAKGYYQAISSGAVGAKNANELMRVALKLSVGGITSTETAIDGLTNALNGFGLKIKDVSKISDVFFIGAKLGKTTVGELAREMGTVAPIASALGVLLEESVSAMSALTLGGNTTSKSATLLASTMAELLKPNEELSKAMKRAGIASAEASIKSIGFEATLRKIVSTTDGTAESLGRLFGSQESIKAVFSLTGKQATQFNNILKETANASGATQEAFDKMSQTTDQKLKILGGSITSLSLEIGTKLLPTFEKVIVSLTNLVGGVNSFVSNIGKYKESFIALGAGIATAGIALGIYAVAVNASTIATKALAVAQGILNAVITANPIGIVVVAIAGLVAGLTYWYRNVDLVNGYMKELYGTIIKSVMPSLEFFIFLMLDLKKVFDFVKAGALYFISTLGKMVSYIIGPTVRSLKTLLETLAKVAGAFDKDLEASLNAILSTMDNVVNDIGEQSDALEKQADSIMDAIKSGEEYYETFNKLSNGINDYSDDIIKAGRNQKDYAEKVKNANDDIVDSEEDVQDAHKDTKKSSDSLKSKVIGNAKDTAKEVQQYTKEQAETILSAFEDQTNVLNSLYAEQNNYINQLQDTKEATADLVRENTSLENVYEIMNNLVKENLNGQYLLGNRFNLNSLALDENTRAFLRTIVSMEAMIEFYGKVETASRLMTWQKLKDAGETELAEAELARVVQQFENDKFLAKQKAIEASEKLAKESSDKMDSMAFDSLLINQMFEEEKLKKYAEVLGEQEVLESLRLQESLKEQKRYREADMEMARLSSEYYIKLKEKENEELIKLQKMSWVEKGVYYVKQYWNKIQPYLNFKTIFQQTGELLKNLWNSMINFNPFESFSNGFKVAFDYVYDYISDINLYEVGAKVVQGFKNGFISVLETLTSPMQYVLEGLSEGFSLNGILNTFRTIGDAFGSVDSFMGGFGLSWKNITNAINDFDYVKYFEACGEALDELVKVGAEFVLTFGEFTATQFINGLIQAKDFALDVFNTLYDSVFEIGNYFATKFIDALGYAKDFMNGEFLNSLKSIAESFATLPKNLIESFAGLNNTVQIFDDHNLKDVLADYKSKIDALKNKGSQDTEKIDEYEKLIKDMESKDLSLVDEEKLKTYKKELEELKKVGLSPIEQDELKSLEDTYKTFQERFDNSFTNQLAKFKEGIADAVVGLQTGIPKMVASLKESFPTIMDELFKNTITLIPTIAKAFTDIAPVLVDSIIDNIPKLTEALSKSLPEVLKTLTSLIPKLSTSFFKIINDIVKTLGESLPNVIKNLMPTVKTIIENISSLLQKVIPMLGEMAKEFVPEIFDTLLKEIPKVVSTLSTSLQSLLPTLGNLASSFINSLSTFLSREAPALIDAVVKQLPKLITSLTGFITTSLPVIVDAVVRNLPTVINALIASLPSIVNSLTEQIPKLINAVLKELPRVIERLLLTASDFVMMMIKNLPSFISKMLEAVPTIITSLAREIPKIIQTVVQAIPQIILAITNALPSIIKSIVDSAPQIMSAIVLAVPQLISALAQKAPEIIQSLVKSFPELVRGIATYAPNMVAEIVRQLPAIITSIIASLPQIMSAIIRMIPSLLYSISAEFPMHLYNAMRNLGNEVWHAIRNGINTIGSAIQSLFKIPASAWGRGTVENFLGIDIPWVRFAEGGHVGGHAKVAGNSLRNDVIPAMLSPGEFVLDRETIRNGDTQIIQTLAQQGVLSPSALQGMGFQLHGFGGWITNIWNSVKDWTGNAGRLLGNVGSSILNGLQAGASGAWNWIKTGTGQVVKWGRGVLPDIWDLLKQLGGGVFESAKAIWDYNRNAINVWDVLSNPFNVIKNAFNNVVGGLLKDKTSNIVRGMFGMANGGMVGGYAKVQGDSKLNDLVPTLLSAGEMVIPRSFVQDGIQGVMNFASSVLGSKGQMEMSQGGFVHPVNFSQGGDDSTLNELKEIKSLLNSLGFTLGKNTLEQKKVLERWDYNGMPPVRS